MSSPRFPATAILLDAKRCPVDKFDALFTKITQERRVRDGYFLCDRPDGAHVLFLVNGSPYAAGRVAGDACAPLEIHEFFTAYTDRPDSPLSFFVADKRLLLGLMVLFRHRPGLTFETSRADTAEILARLAERNADHILALRSGGEWAIVLCAGGRPVASFFPLGSGVAAQAAASAEQLADYVRRRGGVTVDVYDETRATPAGDVILVTPETRGRLVEVFLRVAARVREEETARTASATPREEPLALEPEIPSALPPDDEPPLAESPPATAEPEEPALLDAGLAASFSAVPELPGTNVSAPRAEPERPFALEAEVPPSLPPDDDAPVADLAEPTAEPERAFALETEPAAPYPVLEVSPEAESLPMPERPRGAGDGASDAVAPPPEETLVLQAPEVPIPEVLLFVGDRPLGTFSLAAGELTIGRTPGNSIVIDNAGVSRRHAVIRVVGDSAILEDLGSANGTYVRGQRVEEYTLRDGDEISIVKHRLVYRIPRETGTQPKVEPMADGGQRTMYIDTATIAQAVGARSGPRPEGPAAALRPRLILPDLKKFALEDAEVTLGTGKGCQIQLAGMFVGKEHARIARTKEGQFRIQHVSGLAGTRVNGEKISERILKHGDEIEIGKQKLLFRLER